MKTLFLQESFPLFVVLCSTTLLFAWLYPTRKGLVVTTFIVVVGFLSFFYRVPPRKHIVPSEDTVLAASDGTVKAITYNKDKDTYVVVAFLNIFNQHMQYYPVSGQVSSVEHVLGSFHPAYMLHKSQYNERTTTTIKTATLGDVSVTQIAGQVARRIVNYSRKGDVVKQCDHMGMIKLSSRVDVEFSAKSFFPSVSVGDILTATETVLAHKKLG